MYNSLLRHLIKSHLILIMLTVSSVVLRAQINHYNFENISLKEGLSEVSVSSILQDSEGFMWFGTQDGLNRFDGYDFKVFKTDEGNPNSISSGFIWSIFEDSKKNLWIGTINGLNKYNRNNDSFERFFNNPSNNNSLSDNTINCITEDADSVLWIGTNKGLCKFNEKKKTFTNFYANPSKNSLSNNVINTIFVVTQQEIWIGTDNGLSRLNPQTNVFTSYFMPEWGNKINTILNENNNSLWLGTHDAGLVKFDKIDGTFHQIDRESNIKDVRGIIKDEKGLIWLACFGDYIRLFNPNTNRISKIHDENNSFSIKENKLLTIYKDKSGLIWIGSFSNGIIKYSRERATFNQSTILNDKINEKQFNVRALFLDETSNILWIGTENGLKRWDRKSNRISHFVNDPRNPHTLGHNFIRSNFETLNGSLWIGTFGGGLCKLDKATGKFYRYSLKGNDPISSGSNNIRALKFDHTGKLWIGTDGGGILTYDTNNSSFTQYYSDVETPGKLTSKKIMSIIEDKNNIIWIASFGNGLSSFNPTTGVFNTFKSNPKDSNTISSNYVISINEGIDNTIWIATSGGGLNKFNPQTKKFTHYLSNENTYPSNVLYAIVEDNHGNVWFSSNMGISKFDTKKNTFHNYSVEDGLQGDEFNGNSFFKSLNNEVFFGGTNGLNSFYPDSIKEGNYFSRVLLTSFNLFNKKISAGDIIKNRILLEKSITSTNEISLFFNENFFSIEFSALNLIAPNKIRYAYRLEGFDTDWVKTNAKRRFATYTNLNPGRYVFKVKSTNHYGVWSNNETSLVINIVPPFYMKLWFKLVSILVLCIIMYLAFLYRIKSLKNQKKVLELSVKERTIELAKLNKELEQRNEEIGAQKDLLEERNQEIITVNEELILHRENLEELIKIRTKELEVAKVKAEESDKLKTSFLANMSHEIRTPMNAIVGFTTLLNFPDCREEDKKDYIEQICTNSTALLSLIEDIIIISKIQSNQLEIKKNIFEVNSFITEILETHKILYNLQKNNSIALYLGNQSNEKVFVCSDHQRLKQIFNNVLSNAFKFTSNGYIELGYELKESNIIFYIKDTGIGIPNDKKEIIFARFTKVEDDRTKLFRGVGLGLSISSNLIHLLDGNIWLESEINKGSTFYFSIPYLTNYHNENQKTKPNEQLDKQTPDWSSYKIMIVEDEEPNYWLLQNMLKETGIKTVWFSNGSDALNYLTNNMNDFNLILMDIKMPEMSGIEALTRIRKVLPHIPVIAQTAYALNNDVEEIMNAGFNEYIVKPINYSALILSIRKYLE